MTNKLEQAYIAFVKQLASLPIPDSNSKYATELLRQIRSAQWIDAALIESGYGK